MAITSLIAGAVVSYETYATHSESVQFAHDWDKAHNFHPSGGFKIIAVRPPAKVDDPYAAFSDPEPDVRPIEEPVAFGYLISGLLGCLLLLLIGRGARYLLAAE